VTSISTPKSLYEARRNHMLTSSSSKSPYKFKFMHHNPIFQNALCLSLTTAEIDNERILSEVLELTSSFEQIQETVQLNSQLYEERLVEYEDKIRSLEADVSSSKESIRSKDSEVESWRKKLEEMDRSAEEWGIEKVTMAQSLEKLEVELNESKVKLEDKERELATALEHRRQSVEAEVDSSSMKALSVRLEEMEKDATKRIEEVEAKSTALAAMERSLEEAKNSAEDNSSSMKALSVRLEEMEKEATKRIEEVKAKSTALAAMERSLEETKKSADKSVEVESSSTETLTLRLEEMEKDTTKRIEEVEAKSTALAAIERSLEEAKKSAEVESSSTEALTLRLEEMEKEATKRIEEVEAMSTALAAMERSLEEAKKSAEDSIAVHDKIVDGLETLVRKKDEAISKLEAEVTKSKDNFQEEQREMIKERDDLKLLTDKLRVELNSVTKGTVTKGKRTSFTEELIKVTSKAENQRNELRSEMDISIKEKDDIIKNLGTKIESYESERDSLRKLIRLGGKRVISLIISLPLWRQSYVMY